MNLIQPYNEGKGFLIENEGYVVNKPELITENKDGKLIYNKEDFYKSPLLHCVLQKHSILNGNGRIYPKNVLEEAVSLYREHINKRAAVGEVNHFDSTTISLLNIGLLIEDFYWEDATLIGIVRLPISRGYREMGVESNPADKIANLILEHNINVGISSRGVGEVKKQKEALYVTQYNIICWDFVQMPSTNGAWVYTNPKEVEKHIETVALSGNGKENKKQSTPSKFEKLANIIKKGE